MLRNVKKKKGEEEEATAKALACQKKNRILNFN